MDFREGEGKRSSISWGPENYKHKIKIETKKGTKEWLQSKGVDFEAMVEGESKYTNRVIIKSSNEVGSGLLKEFNEKWVEKITIEKVPSSKKKRAIITNGR
nr:hypothetical protein [Paenibacillus xylanexedens]